MDKDFEAKMDELLTMQAEQCKAEMENGDVIESECKETQEEAKGVLNNFLKYIKSIKFDLKCRKLGKETGVNYKIIKNQFVANILGKIADVLGFAVNLTGNIIEYAVSFIGSILIHIVDFTVNMLNKIINAITFGCGSVCAC